MNKSGVGGWLVKNGAYLGAVGIGLYLLSRYNELLYHTTLEVFSMVVAAAVLIIAWNGRRLLDNDYLLLVGCAYLSFAILDLPHMLSFVDLGVFRGYTPELATQSYVVQRLILAASFMAAPFFLTHRLRPYAGLWTYGALTLGALAVLFFADVGRVLDLSEVPVSPARLAAGGIIVAMLAASLAAVLINRRYFDRDVMWLLVAVMTSFIVSEIALVSGSANELVRLFGHYAQGLALYLSYKSVVETAFVRPQSVLYKGLADRERAERLSSRQFQEVAETLQAALLKVPERLEGVSIVSCYRSSSDVAKIGGDFYDVFEIDNRRIGFALGDVSGKGLEAATTTAEVKSTVRAYAYLNPEPSFVLGKTNDVMYRLLSESQFVTALFGVLDTVSGEVQIASAGHEEPVVCIRESCEFLEAPANLPLGVGFGVQYSVARTRLFLDDGLLAYTDGIPDARRGDERFGRARLKALIERQRGGMSDTMAEDLLAEVMSFSDGVLADDIAMLGLRLTRPDPSAAARAEEKELVAALMDVHAVGE